MRPKISCRQIARAAAAALILISAHGAAQATPANPSKNTSVNSTSGLYLEQEGAMDNRFKIWVTPQAVRIDNTFNNYSACAKAPDWQVYLWRQDLKIITVSPFKTWCNTAFRKYSWTCDLTKPTSKGTSQIFGETVSVYRFGTTPQVGIFMRTSFGDGSNRDDTNHAEISQLSYPGSEHSGPIIYRLQTLPMLPGLTIVAVRLRETGKIEGAISTTKLERRKDISLALFEHPTNLKMMPFKLAYMRKPTYNTLEKEFAESFMK